jgi:hypothetical protein
MASRRVRPWAAPVEVVAGALLAACAGSAMRCRAALARRSPPRLTRRRRVAGGRLGRADATEGGEGRFAVLPGRVAGDAQRTANTITSAGNRKPVKADRGGRNGRQREDNFTGQSLP